MKYKKLTTALFLSICMGHQSYGATKFQFTQDELEDAAIKMAIKASQIESQEKAKYNEVEMVSNEDKSDNFTNMEIEEILAIQLSLATTLHEEEEVHLQIGINLSNDEKSCEKSEVDELENALAESLKSSSSQPDIDVMVNPNNDDYETMGNSPVRFTLTPVAGDGDCVFHAINHNRGNQDAITREDYVQTLRSLMTDDTRNVISKDLYLAVLDVIRVHTVKNKQINKQMNQDECFDKLSSSREYLEDADIKLLQKLYMQNNPIFIWTKENNKLRILNYFIENEYLLNNYKNVLNYNLNSDALNDFVSQTAKTAIHILYNGTNHFDALTLDQNWLYKV